MIKIDARTKIIIIRIIAISMFMEMLDTTVLNTSLPQIAQSFSHNPIELKAVLTVYLLSLGIFIPLSGWVSDRIGESKTLILAIGIFTLSSLGCACALNLSMLVIFRLLQGVGGAFLLPVGRLILARVFEGHETLEAMAAVSTMAILGMMAGPLVGGALTTYLNWRFIFIINLPFGLFGIYYVYRYFPRLDNRDCTPFDFKGFIYIASAIGSLLFLLDIIIYPDISNLSKIVLFLISIGGFFAYTIHSRRVSFPLLNNAIFRNREFLLVSLASFLARITLTTQPFLVALLLQTVYGLTAFQSGLFVIPQLMGSLLGKRYIRYFIEKKGYKYFLVSTAAITIVSFISVESQIYWFMPYLFIIQLFAFGFPVAMLYTGMNSYAYSTMREPDISSASSLYSAAIQLSGSFGITLAAITMVVAIGHVDLTHTVPAIAFKIVFLVQPLYLFIALWIFTKLNYQS